MQTKPMAAVTLLAAMVVNTAQAVDGNSAAPRDERELINILESDAPAADKAITCKRLAVYGTRDAVPALAPLLTDVRLASWARIALEAIPGPEADAALREASRTLEGRLLVGIINSIGVRRDALAVDMLVVRLRDEDADVASAAAIALGRIATPPATEVMRQSLMTAPVAVRNAVAEGVMLCAERLFNSGQVAEAAEIYDEVRQAELPRQRILEATRGAILARQSNGVPLLVEQLKSPDNDLFQIGLSTVRELSGAEFTDAVAGAVPQATPDRAALLLHALADRGDTAALPVVMQSARSGPKQVRLAALGVLSRLGDASCVPDLLEMSLAADMVLARQAAQALAGLSGQEVDAEIAARLPNADGRRLQVLLELVGQRRINATTNLVQAIDHADPKIRRAALTALGATVGLEELSLLIARVASPRDAEDTATAAQALHAACVRMPQREPCARQLAAAISDAPVAAQCAFLEILADMGGEVALAAMGSAAHSANEQLQDTGSRLLGKWMTLDAAPVLLDLATSATDEKVQIRAIRGHIRLARQFPMSDGQRAEMCRAALAAAGRTAEQRLVLEVLERYPSSDMLEVAVQAKKLPGLREEATRIAAKIAEEVGGTAEGSQESIDQNE